MLLQQVADTTVSPGTALSISIAAQSPGLSPLSYELIAAPPNAAITSGRFEWTPRYLDLGKSLTIILRAYTAENISDTVSFTVTVAFSSGQKDSLAGLVGKMECFAMVYPRNGDTFAYGDTLPIVFVSRIDLCDQAVTICDNTAGQFPRDLQDPAEKWFTITQHPYPASDTRKYIPINDSVWVGIYRQVLLDTVIANETIVFGGDKMIVAVMDHYAPEGYMGVAVMEGTFTIEK